MKHNVYSKIKEEEYIYKLDNGLELIVIPKKGFINFYCGVMIGFGSKHKSFIVNDQRVDIPQGVAHFIEHRLFIKEHSHDVTVDFADNELECNAYTDFNSTVYYFNGAYAGHNNLNNISKNYNADINMSDINMSIDNRTKNLYKGIDILLDFVQKPYFDEKGVETEKDIIIQELMMYLDSPDNQLNYGVLKNMFNKYPIREDTVGTIEEIKSISKDLLYKCYSIFYHPKNMKLIIVGDVDHNEIYNNVLINQSKKQFNSYQEFEILFEDEIRDIDFRNIVNKTRYNNIKEDIKKIPNIKMDIFSSKYAFGIRPYFDISFLNKEDFIKKSICISINVLNNFSPISTFYQKLLDEKLITSPISFSSYFDKVTGYILLFTNTDVPEKLNSLIYKKALSKNTISRKRFNEIKKKIYGGKITDLNSISSLFFSYLDSLSVNYNFYDYFELIYNLEYEDVLVDINKDMLTSFIIYPLN